MSNIYIQEPPTKGKVVLKTTIGEIEIELWSKECPKASRNFVQLCMEGYYDGTIFHRVIKDFIAQGGDPTGSGQGGESIYGEPFKDEFHSRLRFNRRGLVAMASSQQNDNGSQFFFTLGPCPELNSKNTLFGKVVGNTIYNMIKLNECEVVDERPLRCERIISTEIIFNPFPDIKPRNLKESIKKPDEEKPITKTINKIKNYGLLSFGNEAEEDEEELETVTKEYKTKPKSAHDIGDPNLLPKKANENESESTTSDSDESSENENNENESESSKVKKKIDIDSIKSKLKKQEEPAKKFSNKTAISNIKNEEEPSRNKTKEEIKKLELELINSKNKLIKLEEKELEKKEELLVVKKYKEDVEKYEHLKKKKLKTGKEDKTIELLNSFREKLFKAKEISNPDESESKQVKLENDNGGSGGANGNQATTKPNSLSSILVHRLEVEEEIKTKVIDANIADNERYDIFDPRNPLNKRKREKRDKKDRK